MIRTRYQGSGNFAFRLFAPDQPHVQVEYRRIEAPVRYCNLWSSRSSVDMKGRTAQSNSGGGRRLMQMAQAYVKKGEEEIMQDSFCKQALNFAHTRLHPSAISDSHPKSTLKSAR